MTGLDNFGSFGAELYGTIVHSSSRLRPEFLLAFLLIALALFKLRRIGGSFLAWAFPRTVYFHPSTLVDLKIFLLGRALAVAGVFQFVAVAAVVAGAVAAAIPATGLRVEALHPALVALIVLVAGDFAVYWVHRIHHENIFLWPFHALHHSAEVMTPITVYRKHPIYDILGTLVRGAFVGGVQGVMLGLVVGELSLLKLAGINAGYLVFNMLGSNLRHTHIWLSYGRVLEHLFISPAQHQIHHSAAPEHHNKNYGEVLAVWDWIFGTLYVPARAEVLTFGLGDASGRPLPQRHDSLASALVVPVRDCVAAIRRRWPGRHGSGQGGGHQTPAE